MENKKMIYSKTVKYEARKICAFLIVVFSGFYLNVTTYAPIYFSTIIALILLLMLFKRLSVTRKAFHIIVIALIYSFYVLIFGKQGENDNTQFNFLFSILYLIASMLICRIIEKGYLLKISCAFINFSIILLIVEAVWRFTHPRDSVLYNAISNISFYKFKFGSIMYQDSNFVGIFVICLLFFSVYLHVQYNVNTKIQQFILLALCVLSLSRAVIISSFVFYYFFSGTIKRNTKKLLLLGGIVFSVYVITHYVLYDGSFLSKIDIVGRTIDFLNNASVSDRLFGVGLGRSRYYIGIGSHNFIITYLLETGYIGFVLMLLLWVTIFLHQRKKHITL